MKSGKGTGPDGILVEIITAFDDVGIETINLLNKMNSTDSNYFNWHDEINTSCSPKKPESTECGQHRTTSLTSQITKYLLRIILLRIRGNVKHDIAEKQCGFVEGKGTSNTIYIPRTVAERAIEVQTDWYVCLIYDTIAFDTLKHAELMKLFQALSAAGRDLRIVKKIYWE